nr:glycerol-3-phosphate dehydrogenase/oxidase [Dechloromonas sp.]
MTSPTRAELLDRLRYGKVWDVVIVGGGASGLGAAVDAAARGYSTLLLERGDYACGTSSRSTKLIHGGVRYLRQGDIGLVRHALAERNRLLINAPHLVHPLPFIIPARSAVQRLYYGAGLRLYDLLAGASSLQASRLLDRGETLAALPGLDPLGVAGGVRYWDAQFDDARLAIALMRTASEFGAICLNYSPVEGLLQANGRVCGVAARDVESGESFEIQARVVINATGVYADAVRRFEQPDSTPILSPSQGIHLVLDADFLPGGTALMIPETADGRVMFAIPWEGRVLLGTTDTPRRDLPVVPLPFAEEIDFLLDAAGKVLLRAPTRADIRSAFAGLRPLLDAGRGAPGGTAALSREHAVLVSQAGLVTVAGGKWTTYRLMAEQVVNKAAEVGELMTLPCATAMLRLAGGEPEDAEQLSQLPGQGIRLHPAFDFDEAAVRYACRYEAARTVEDVLARRSRALFIDATAARACIGRVGELLAEELQLSSERLEDLISQARTSSNQFSCA